VTAAGIFHGPDLRLAHEVSVDDFLVVLGVNLVGTFSVIKHAAPAPHGRRWRDRDDRVDGRDPWSRSRRGDTASKGGVNALTRLLAVQYGPLVCASTASARVASTLR